MGNDQFPVSVFLYATDGMWIAQGLEYDIVAHGLTSDEASKNFNKKFGAELAISMELGDPSPLSGIPKAPQEFWNRYNAIKTADVGILHTFAFGLADPPQMEIQSTPIADVTRPTIHPPKSVSPTRSPWQTTQTSPSTIPSPLQ